MSEKPGLVIFGAGGHGKVVADAALAAGFLLLGFLDDHIAKGTIVLSDQNVELRVLGGFEWMEHRPPELFNIGLGVGSNVARCDLSRLISSRGITPVTIIHPAATISRFATLGAGTVVAALAVVNPDARIGAGVIINTGAVIEHDCTVGDFAHVSPNASLAGAVRLGDLSHVGTGAVILPGIAVGSNSIVGAGAVVNRDVGNDQLVLGVPARARKSDS